jgi:hypothetical protein
MLSSVKSQAKHIVNELLQGNARVAWWVVLCGVAAIGYELHNHVNLW